MSTDTLMLHADDLLNNKHIDALAAALKHKMWLARVNKGRAGWLDDSTQASLNRQMWEHLFKGDPLDVAAYCMMLHTKDQSIEPTLVDAMRILVFADMEKRLAYGPNDEGSIGPYDTLDKLNQIASESGGKSEVQKNSERYNLFIGAMLGELTGSELTPSEQQLKDLLTAKGASALNRKSMNVLIDTVLAEEGN